jgi:hypothetical protein
LFKNETFAGTLSLIGEAESNVDRLIFDRLKSLNQENALPSCAAMNETNSLYRDIYLFARFPFLYMFNTVAKRDASKSVRRSLRELWYNVLNAYLQLDNHFQLIIN